MNQFRTIATMTFLLISCLIYSQNTTTESKSCGKCGKAVSVNSKVGDICPYCGVRWGDENINTRTVTKPSYNLPSTKPSYTLPSTKYPNNPNKSKYPTNTVKKKKNDPFDNKSLDYTTTWLNEKLNAYKINYTYCTDYGIVDCFTYKDYNFKFESDYLIVKYNYKEDDIVNYIPLYDINYTSGNNYSNDFSISTNAKTIIRINKTTDKREYVSYIQIGFEASRESGLMDMVIQAFKKITSLSTKPTNSSLPIYSTEIDTNRPSEYETKEWFLSKLIKYGNNKYSYEISGMDLLISTRLTNDKVLNKFAVNYIIPLCECSIYKIDKSYNFNQVADIVLNSKSKNIKYYSGYSNGYQQKLELDFELERETDLINRLNKALNNLKYYCPQIIEKKEKF